MSPRGSAAARTHGSARARRASASEAAEECPMRFCCPLPRAPRQCLCSGPPDRRCHRDVWRLSLCPAPRASRKTRRLRPWAARTGSSRRLPAPVADCSSGRHRFLQICRSWQMAHRMVGAASTRPLSQDCPARLLPSTPASSRPGGARRVPGRNRGGADRHAGIRIPRAARLRQAVPRTPASNRSCHGFLLESRPGEMDCSGRERSRRGRVSREATFNFRLTLP